MLSEALGKDGGRASAAQFEGRDAIAAVQGRIHPEENGRVGRHMAKTSISSCPNKVT